MKPTQDTTIEADKLVRDIKRATCRKFSAEEKIRIVLAGLRGVLLVATGTWHAIAFI